MHRRLPAKVRVGRPHQEGSSLDPEDVSEVRHHITVHGATHDDAAQRVRLRQLRQDCRGQVGAQDPRPQLPDRMLEVPTLQKGL